MTARLDGQRRGRIASFLLSSLTGTTQDRYLAARTAFSNDLADLGLDMHDLDEHELDWLLAERVVDIYEDTDGAVGLGTAATLVAAVSKANPRDCYKTAWKALDVWRARRPPSQALAVPWQLAFGMISWLVMAGRADVACAMLLCYAGLLRASEALMLRWRSFLRTPDGWVVILGVAKRGLEQKVVITNLSVVLWLDLYSDSTQPGTAGRRDGERVAHVSYAKLQYWLRKAAAALGFGSMHWTSHGLRRGGATELLRQGCSLANIMLFGRWLAERSCREYLRRGDVALLRLEQAIRPEDWKRAEELAAMGPYVWKAAAAAASKLDS
jgi:integrase